MFSLFQQRNKMPMADFSVIKQAKATPTRRIEATNIMSETGAQEKRLFGSMSSFGSLLSHITKRGESSTSLAAEAAEKRDSIALSDGFVDSVNDSREFTPGNTPSRTQLAQVVSELAQIAQAETRSADTLIAGSNVAAVAIKAALTHISAGIDDKALNRAGDYMIRNIECAISGKTKKMDIKVMCAAGFSKGVWNERILGDVLSHYSDETALHRSKAGKSNSYLLWSADRKYVAKSMKHSEIEVAKSMLPDYCRHLNRHPNSLITRYVLIFRYRCGKKTEYIGIMQNVLPKEEYLGNAFDLKGSTHGRYAESEETVKKDLNFLERYDLKPFNYFVGKEEEARIVVRILAEDIAFLSKHGVIDYSFLCGFVGDDRWAGAIIDIFTSYGVKKHLEKWFLGMMHDNISCTDPEKYSRRFLGFLAMKVFRAS